MEKEQDQGGQEEIIGPRRYYNIINEKLSYWRDLMVERLYSYKEALNRKSKDPAAMIQTQQGKMSIQAIVETRWQGLVEATGNVSKLEELLEKSLEDEQAVYNEALEMSKKKPAEGMVVNTEDMK